MFGTVIIDAYRKNEIIELAEAIDDLCSPNDNYGWASTGIYCFWDYCAKAILYIGLASDLCVRFKQHNGILPVEIGSKQEEIKDYFSKNDRLGYTIFVQSPLSQPLTHRNKKMYEKIAKQINLPAVSSEVSNELRLKKAPMGEELDPLISNTPVNDLFSEQGKNDMKITEGILIESFRENYGYFPPWNKMGGSVAGQNSVMDKNINIVKSFCSPDDFHMYPIVAKSTIRELSSNPEYVMHEIFLHAVRIIMLTTGMDFHKALDFYNQQSKCEYVGKTKESGYDNKRLVV